MQIRNWLTWNTNIQSYGFCVVAFNVLFDVFFPRSAHPLLFFDKWFVQIYLNGNSSSKQRHEHNNLATIQQAKLKETHEYSMSLQIVKP
jgi:hypothetical protein